MRIEAIGLNRAEALFRADRYIERVRRLPARLGNEAAGVVEAVGPGVAGFEEGQAVSVVPSFSHNDYGVYAERALVPAGALLPRGPGVDAVTGAAVWMPFLTAYGAMVAVGGVRAGAAEVVVSDEEDVPARLLDLTGGRGAEFVFDAVAGPGVAAPARAVAPDGTVFLWGAQSGQPTPCPGFDLGMPALNLRTYTMLEVTGDPRRMFRATAFITSGLRTGSLSAVVDRVFPLTEIVEAHRSMEANEQFGEIVVSTMA